MMLSAPAITRGARDFVPDLSSTLLMLKMATIDVKATSSRQTSPYVSA